MDKTLIKAIQCRVAVSAIEASGVRGRGLSKTAVSLRDYLTAIKLDKFSLSSERLFKRHLDSKTEDLLQKLAPGALLVTPSICSFMTHFTTFISARSLGWLLPNRGTKYPLMPLLPAG